MKIKLSAVALLTLCGCITTTQESKVSHPPYPPGFDSASSIVEDMQVPPVKMSSSNGLVAQSNLSGTNIVVSWEDNGTEPYLVQFSTNLINWSNLGRPTANTNYIAYVDSPMGFFRIQALIPMAAISNTTITWQLPNLSMPDTYENITVKRSLYDAGPWTLVATLNSYSNISQAHPIPQKGETVLVNVDDTGWMAVGRLVNEVGSNAGGQYEVMSIPSSTQVLLKYLDVMWNVNPGESADFGAYLLPGSWETDQNPPAGQTYYYLVEANTANGEVVRFNVVSASNVSDAPGTFKWVCIPERSPSPGADRAAGVASDANSNMIVIGDKFSSMFVEKWSKDKVLQWAFQASGANFGKCVTTDTAGNVYFGGFTQGGIDLGGGSLLPAYGANEIGILAKWDANKNHLWSWSFPASGGAGNIAGIVVDTPGNAVYIIGNYAGTIDLSNTGAGVPNHVSVSASSVFLAKLNATTGALIWYKSFGEPGGGQNVGTSIALDKSVYPPRIYITGKFSGAINFGGGVILSTESAPGGARTDDIFLAKFDIDGNHIWSYHYGGNSFDIGYAVAVNPINGHVYLGGRFWTTIDLGGPILTRQGTRHDAFLVCLDSLGAFQWQKHISGNAGTFDDVYAITVDNAGNLFVTGTVSGTQDFGGGPLVAGYNDVYIVKYNSAGVLQWVKTFGNYSIDNGFALALSADGHIYTAGVAYGAVDFGDGIIINLGASSGAFVTKHRQ